jgi:hypothetical protein
VLDCGSKGATMIHSRFRLKRKTLQVRGGYSWFKFVFKSQSGRVILGFFLVFSALAAETDHAKGEGVAKQSDLKSQISALDRATEIILMTIPSGRRYIYTINAYYLPKVSCVYSLHDVGVEKSKVVSALSDGILQDNGIIQDDGHNELVYLTAIDLRIGIVFKKDSEVIGEFYFADVADSKGIPGWFDRRRVWLRPSALINIRALPAETKATLLASDKESVALYEKLHMKFCE